jgi:hypothetical protein
MSHGYHASRLCGTSTLGTARHRAQVVLRERPLLLASHGTGFHGTRVCARSVKMLTGRPARHSRHGRILFFPDLEKEGDWAVLLGPYLEMLERYL